MADLGLVERAVRALVIAAMAVALATPVAAQDTSADFREAYTRLYGERAPEALSNAEVGLGILPTIAGTWISADRAFESPEFDAEGLARFCANGFGTALENAGDYGFTTQSLRNGEGQGNLRTYMFTAGRYYSYVTDLNAHLDRLLGDRDRTSLPPAQILGLLSNTSGVARVEAIGPDVLMIDSPNTAPMVLVRCP